VVTYNYNVYSILDSFIVSPSLDFRLSFVSYCERKFSALKVGHGEYRKREEGNVKLKRDVKSIRQTKLKVKSLNRRAGKE